MEWLVANDVSHGSQGEQERPAGVLEKIDLPVNRAEVALASGRRYELATLPEGDRLTVRGRGGAVLLRVLVTEAGPVLSFESADVEIAAARRLALSAAEVSIEARGTLVLRAGGDCTQAVGGERHTRVGGADRLEAAAVQLQANEGAVEVRAAGRIAIDGEHIGLNDDPCPRPFAWSAAAGPDGEAE